MHYPGMLAVLLLVEVPVFRQVVDQYDCRRRSSTHGGDL